MNEGETIKASRYKASLEQFLFIHSNESVLKLFDIRLKNAIANDREECTVRYNTIKVEGKNNRKLIVVHRTLFVDSHNRKGPQHFSAYPAR